MTILDFADEEALGRVQSVDTATVIVRVDDVEALRALQVNRLVALQSSLAGHKLIGVIHKITRTALEEAKVAELERGDEAHPELNLVRITLIGTLLDRDGTRANIFRRTLETVPEIDACCFALEGERLTRFMGVISESTGGAHRLSLGAYTLDPNAEAYVNGNKLFQRHAIVVGSTGSGKSWTTARLLEQVAELKSANAIVFDIHGEYASMAGDGFVHLRVAGPGDIHAKGGHPQSLSQTADRRPKTGSGSLFGVCHSDHNSFRGFGCPQLLSVSTSQTWTPTTAVPNRGSTTNRPPAANVDTHRKWTQTWTPTPTEPNRGLRPLRRIPGADFD